MKKIQISENATISKVQRIKGIETDTISAVMHLNGQKSNITFDTLTDNVIIHDWYNFVYDVAMSLIEPIRSYMHDLMV